MSKAAAKRKPAKKPESTPGFSRGRFAEVSALIDSRDLSVGPPALPAKVDDAVIQLVVDIAQLIPHMPELNPMSEGALSWIIGLLRYCTAQGFSMALYRYANELESVPELNDWHRRRDRGVRRGHETQSQAREARYQRIRDKWAAMEAAGARVTNETVAAAVREDGEKKCSARTVQRAFQSMAKSSQPAKRSKR